MPPIAEPVPIEDLCHDATHYSCACGNVVIFFSAAEPDSTFCDRNASLVIDYARRYPAGLGMLVLIAADEPPPSKDARQAIRNGYLAMKDVIRAGVLVVEGEGFAAAAKRSVITLIQMSTSLPFSMSVAGNLNEGAAKLARMLGPILDTGLTVQRIAEAASAAKGNIVKAASAAPT
jgi:hypothetical protein